MISTQTWSRPLAFRFGATPHSGGLPLAAPPPRSQARIDGVAGRHGYAAMAAAYRASGGIARGDDLGRLLVDLNRGDYISLARLIADGEVFGFSWCETCWIPMFQFALHDLSVRPQVKAVLAELSGAYSGWSLACWFADPNEWLDGRRPVDLLQADLNAVREAARADRFVSKG